ncbi:MAG: cupin domain-containing protein [Thermomicrobiales bacterium]|nr:cupin domain-containing protein [Thermomicrobiales bacterium]
MPYLKSTLPDSIAVLSGSYPPNEKCFLSESLQIIAHYAEEDWPEEPIHCHRDSDEAYIVMEGAITLVIDGESVVVNKGEICTVGRGSFHAITEAQVPYRGLVVRAPSVQDKEYLE